MNDIPIHSFDQNHVRAVAATCDSVLSKLLTGAKSDGRQLAQIQDTALMRAACEIGVSSDWDLARGHLLLAARATLANFDSAAHVGERISHKLTGELSTAFDGLGPNAGADVLQWINGYYAAMICREDAVLDALCAFPATLLRQASGVQAEEYVYDWAATLRSVWLDDGGTATHLQRALDGTDESSLRFADQWGVLKISVPLMEMLTRLFSEGAARFDEAFAKALASHRDYWTDASRSDDPRGLMALGPLALACVAHDMRHEIAVRSDYVPWSLIAEDAEVYR
jgi:hypothetical protein